MLHMCRFTMTQENLLLYTSISKEQEQTGNYVFYILYQKKVIFNCNRARLFRLRLWLSWMTIGYIQCMVYMVSQWYCRIKCEIKWHMAFLIFLTSCLITRDVSHGRMLRGPSSVMHDMVLRGPCWPMHDIVSRGPSWVTHNMVLMGPGWVTHDILLMGPSWFQAVDPQKMLQLARWVISVSTGLHH